MGPTSSRPSRTPTRVCVGFCRWQHTSNFSHSTVVAGDQSCNLLAGRQPCSKLRHVISAVMCLDWFVCGPFTEPTLKWKTTLKWKSLFQRAQGQLLTSFGVWKWVIINNLLRRRCCFLYHLVEISSWGWHCSGFGLLFTFALFWSWTFLFFTFSRRCNAGSELLYL